MRKAEMESHAAQYDAIMKSARGAERIGQYEEAISLARNAWLHIDGMMRHEGRNRGIEFESIDAVDIVLQYAPLLFDTESLDALEALLKGTRRIERDTTDDLGKRLATAREEMHNHYRLWNHLENTPDARQDELRAILGGDQRRWSDVTAAWERIGLIRRQKDQRSYILSFRTRMDDHVSAKCSACGSTCRAPKSTFLAAIQCERCGQIALFVILSTSVGTQAGE